jgi:hypothetical protein
VDGEIKMSDAEMGDTSMEDTNVGGHDEFSGEGGGEI